MTMTPFGVANPKPQLIYGTGSSWFKDDSSTTTIVHRPTVEGIKAAIDVGYRNLDGAQMYGTEVELGMAIIESGVPRSEFNLTTKAAGVDDIEGRLESSLEKLQTNYVDLYLIHSPFPATSPEELQHAWYAMERCLSRGLTKKIGVSNFDIRNMQIILEIATIRPAVNQIEIHPYLQQPELYEFLKENEIPLQGFASLTPLKSDVGGRTPMVCKKLATQYGVSESAVLLEWVMAQGASVVTTSSKKERLAKMLEEIGTFALKDEEIEEIRLSGAGKKVRGFFAEEFAAAEAT